MPFLILDFSANKSAGMEGVPLRKKQEMRLLNVFHPIFWCCRFVLGCHEVGVLRFCRNMAVDFQMPELTNKMARLVLMRPIILQFVDPSPSRSTAGVCKLTLFVHRGALARMVLCLQ